MRIALWTAAACIAISASASALSIDSSAQLHAAVGQPLAVSIPISLEPGEAAKLFYRVEPGHNLAAAEDHAAAAVVASFDASGQRIDLISAARINVPALSLHLSVGVGGVVVDRDISILFDLPDPNAASSPMRPSTALPVESDRIAPGGLRTSSEAPQQPVQLAIRHEEAHTAISFGDTGSSVSEPDTVSRPVATGAAETERPAAPRHVFVRAGDSLGILASRVSAGTGFTADRVALALFEFNRKAFPGKDPQHPIMGRRLEIPAASEIIAAPEFRVDQFKQFLRDPARGWQKYEAPGPLKGEDRTGVSGGVLEWFERLPYVAVVARVGAGILVIITSILGWSRRRRQLGSKSAAERRHVAASAVLAGPLPQVKDGQRDDSSLKSSRPEENAEIVRLREILEHNPGRADIRLRLVQRLFEANRVSDFAEAALPLEPLLSSEAWQRVKAMGHALLPGDFRFAPPPVSDPALDGMSSLLEAQTEARAPSGGPAPVLDFDFEQEMRRVEAVRDAHANHGKRAA